MVKVSPLPTVIPTRRRQGNRFDEASYNSSARDVSVREAGPRRVADLVGIAMIDCSLLSEEITLFNHEPPAYRCPFCSMIAGGETEANTQRDIVRRSGLAIAFISPRWWPNNHGHVLVVSNAHHENLYDLPAEYGHAVHDLVREMAVAVRDTYGCDGISVRQHNEPAGNQDAWHYHVHVFPRYAGDDLYGSRPYPQFVGAEQRWPYADKLRTYFA